MVIKYIPDRRGIGDASFDAILDAKVQKVADKIAAKAKAIALKEGLTQYADSIQVTEGQRPKGRGFREVIADTPDGEKREWGDTDTARLRILGRASGVKVFPDD